MNKPHCTSISSPNYCLNSCEPEEWHVELFQNCHDYICTFAEQSDFPEKEWNGKTTEKWPIICLTLAEKCEQICGQ
jgi:hypothetical protein